MHVTSVRNLREILRVGYLDINKAKYYPENPESIEKKKFFSLRSDSVLDLYRHLVDSSHAENFPHTVLVFKPEILDQEEFSHISSAQIFGRFLPHLVICPSGKVIVSAKGDDSLKVKKVLKYILKQDCANEIIYSRSLPIYSGFLEQIILPKNITINSKEIVKYE